MPLVPMECLERMTRVQASIFIKAFDAEKWRSPMAFLDGGLGKSSSQDLMPHAGLGLHICTHTEGVETQTGPREHFSQSPWASQRGRDDGKLLGASRVLHRPPHKPDMRPEGFPQLPRCPFNINIIQICPDRLFLVYTVFALLNTH